MKIFESFDEREKAVENAAGNVAFKVFWVLMLISIFFIVTTVMARLPVSAAISRITGLIYLDMVIALCVKYYYCWTNNINKKLLITKFIISVVASIIFLMLLDFVFSQFLK